MTRKARLQAWAAQLNAPVPADANVAQLEQAIEYALANSATPEPDCPGLSRDGYPWMAEAPAPQYSFRDALVNNARVLRQELPGTAKAVASNLFG